MRASNKKNPYCLSVLEETFLFLIQEECRSGKRILSMIKLLSNTSDVSWVSHLVLHAYTLFVVGMSDTCDTCFIR